MNISIREHLNMVIYGFSGVAVKGDYTGTAFRLMDKIWPTVKEHGLKTKGLNIWVYEPGDRVFAGVELAGAPPEGTGLELKNISLAKYAYYKHIGPYSLIKQAGENMRHELKNYSLTPVLPYIEIYGHWTNDEALLETELLMSVDSAL